MTESVRYISNYIQARSELVADQVNRELAKYTKKYTTAHNNQTGKDTQQRTIYTVLGYVNERRENANAARFEDDDDDEQQRDDVVFVAEVFVCLFYFAPH